MLKEKRSGLIPFDTSLTSGLYSETAFFRACDKILFINNAIGLFLSTIALIFVWDSPSTGQWFVLAAIGFLMVIGQACNLQAFKRADATFVLPFSYSTLIFATIYDFSVFSVVPDLISYLGSAVIVFAALLLTVPEMRKSNLVH